MTAPAYSAPRPIDSAALARAAARLAAAETAPWLHGEVARRMAERLPVIRLKPDTVIDWCSRSGASRDALRQAYPRAAVLPVEWDCAEPVKPPWWHLRARPRELPAVAAAALPAAAGQLLWANMVLHGVADPVVLMGQWHRALGVEGFLMLSTLGPGSLAGLREIYRDAGWGPAHAAFIDMHDLGDMLVQAGFADPVMDQEVLTLTWASAQALLAELRGLGSNADLARCAGLRTPRWRARLLAALRERSGQDGRIALDFELVYGHAFKPPPRLAGETRFGVDELRAMARSPRPRGQEPVG